MASIYYINQEDDEDDKREKDFRRKPIKMYINSFGGSVIDVISCSKTPIYTICNGYVMRAAFQLLLAGHKRYITPHATLMYHQIYCWRSGKYEALKHQGVNGGRSLDKMAEEAGKFTRESVLGVLVVDKPKVRKVTFNAKKLDSYFDPTMTNEDIEELIIKLLEKWKEEGGTGVGMVHK